MAGQQVEWTTFAGSFGGWSRGRVTGQPDSLTGEQAVRWRFLQEQAERKKTDRKNRRTKGRRS